MKNIAIFASGSGTNAENIIRHFRRSTLAKVALIVTDNPEAYVLERAKNHNIPSVTIPRKEFMEAEKALNVLKENGIDYIVLAGFLCLVPAAIVNEYPGRIVNIHPALLPAYGGKGMYGDRVHKAVVGNGEKESGITIHSVNEHYDEGDILAQYRVAVLPGDTPETLAAKIHELEYRYYPEIIEKEIAGIK